MGSGFPFDESGNNEKVYAITCQLFQILGRTNSRLVQPQSVISRDGRN